MNKWVFYLRPERLIYQRVAELFYYNICIYARSLCMQGDRRRGAQLVRISASWACRSVDYVCLHGGLKWQNLGVDPLACLLISALPLSAVTRLRKFDRPVATRSDLARLNRRRRHNRRETAIHPSYAEVVGNALCGYFIEIESGTPLASSLRPQSTEPCF